MSFYRCVSPKTGVFFKKRPLFKFFFLFVYRKAKKCLVLQIDGEIEPTRMAVWVGVQVQEGIPIWQKNLNSDYRLAKNSTKPA